MKSRRLIASPEAYEHWFKLAQSKGAAWVQTLVSEWPTDVRFGSQADIVRYQRDVRFTPKSGHWFHVLGCPLCAITGQGASQQKFVFVLSARRASDDEKIETEQAYLFIKPQPDR